MKGLGSYSIQKTTMGTVGLIMLLGILIAANVIIGNLRIRADFTEENLYTLSDGTRNMLAALDRSVTIKLFSSADANETPVYLRNYAREVKDLLTEYKLAANGNLTIEEYDPQPDSDEEEWAQRYGISGQPLDMFGPPLYFGLVATCADRNQVIPAMDPRTQNLLEYTLTRLIYRVAHPEKPLVGVMSSLPVMGSQTPPYPMPGMPRPQPRPAWITFRDLQQDYRIREIDPGADSIDPELQALILVHPKELSDTALFAIDQFVLRGGRLLAFLDPMSLADMESSPAANPMMGGMNRTPSDLAPLLKAWGIGYDPDRVLVDFRSASRLRGAGNRIEESPVWLSLVKENMSHEDILTTQLESVMIPFGGAFVDNSGPDLTVIPLLSASQGAGRINAMNAQFGGESIRREFAAEALPLNIAIRITGKFTTAFPDGAPATDNSDEEGEAKPVTEQGGSLKEGTGSVMLFADSDLLYDRFCVEELNFFGSKGYRPLNDNLSLFDNSVEQMAGSSDLIGIRSRGKLARPFERVVELQKKAVAAWQAQEATLEAKLQETQRQLREMDSDKQSDQRFIISKQQRAAINRFRSEELEIKKELKKVRKSLRSDIEKLGVKIKVVNIAMMPILVVLAGVGFWLGRRFRK